MCKPKLVLMVGLPGSGKSTYAMTKFSKGYTILSSDSIRKELFGDEGSQENNKLVFETLYSHMVDALKHKRNVVVDATNINVKTRLWTLERVKDMKIKRIAILLETDIETCKERDKKRTRKVEDYVIERYAKEFEAPTKAEGFDKIKKIKNFHI